PPRGGCPRSLLVPYLSACAPATPHPPRPHRMVAPQVGDAPQAAARVARAARGAAAPACAAGAQGTASRGVSVGHRFLVTVYIERGGPQGPREMCTDVS
ncbi:MAG: hypothetical protein K2L27_04545, partial [Muribaculaceae bacterium]|nr:hypothetical protein [Muribaculaceae bacterium]